MSPLEKILGKLGRYRHAGNGYRAKCPGHDGQSADSLSLTEAEDGAALVHCFGGCDHRHVLHALGLDAQDLFPEGDVRRNGPRPKGGKPRQPKPPKTDGDKLILMFTAHHISGLLIGPPPTELPDESMGSYVGLVELLGEVFQQGGHDAVQAEWVNLQPALAESAPRLCDAVNRRVRTRLGTPLPGTAEGRQRTPVPRGMKVSTLLRKDFPPVHAVVPGVILEGLQLMVGKPKLGKTRLMLDIAVAVACGGKALGTLDVEPGPVLYVSLEDPERRLQQRFRNLLAGDASPDTLEYATAWPRLDEGGLQDLEHWIACHPGARLIVIDPLKRIRPRGRSRGNAYDEDYEALQALQDFVNRHPGLAIVVIHHSNKLRNVEDVMDLISGSTGLPAGADGFAILRRPRGTAEASLTVVHRDLEEDREHALQSDPHTGGWTVLGPAAAYRLSPERQAILEILRQAEGPMSPKDIGLALGRQDKKGMDALYFLLRAMREAGDIDSPARGLYTAQNAQNAQNAQEPQDARVDQDTQVIGTAADISSAAEAILSPPRGTAQDPTQDASLGNACENGPTPANLSDLSDLRTLSPSTAPDACPECGGSDWHHRADGAMVDENPSCCFFCGAPLLEGESYEIIPGAELCAECMARPDGRDHVHEISRHPTLLQHHHQSRTGDDGDELSPPVSGGAVEKKPVRLGWGAGARGPLTPPRLRVRAGPARGA